MNARSHPRRQHGAATLIVVMVLFFVMSLVAAYASRNLIFEQKTSANLYLATSVAGTADAGLDWALGLLNSGRIDDDCKPSTNPLAPSFRQRYLDFDTSSGGIAVKPGVRDGPLWPMCWFDSGANAWNCHCPSDPAAPGSIATTPSATAVPSFRVRFVNLDNAVPPTRSGMVRVEVQACPQFDAACLSFPAAHATECTGTACAMIALSPGLKSPPVTALTARGSIGAPLTASSPNAGGAGFAVVAGGSIAPTVIAHGPAGVPASRLMYPAAPSLSDPLLTEERMFAAVFGAWPLTYDAQPGAVTIDCSSSCGSTVIRNAIELNPGRVFVLDGDVALDGGAPIGTETEPVTLVVNGNLGFSAPTTVHGLVYVRAANWVTSGHGEILGAVVAQGDVTGAGSFEILYDKAILERLQHASGSMVLIPGGWKDFP
ncbi:MAG TPA: pilus assembly PilX N-terminal domain-containing protein [Rubrivivax sp.]|nr:pilus assembly PilX N-terminal domain-containing protein [Burkholderiales bacterium]HNT38810.1 pilus assembly PilX N-terminal domain-containing protein [Rubrivivax sp.]